MEYILVSKLSGKPIRKPNYLAELVLSRKAKKQSVVINAGFWNDPIWKKEYMNQVVAANALLKIFEFSDIVHILTTQASWVFSLRYKGLIEMIQSYVTKRKMQEELAKKVEVKVEEEVNLPEQSFKQKKNNNLGSKLRKLE